MTFRRTIVCDSRFAATQQTIVDLNGQNQRYNPYTYPCRDRRVAVHSRHLSSSRSKSNRAIQAKPNFS